MDGGETEKQAGPSGRPGHHAGGCDSELLSLLCCPETHQSLTPASAVAIDELNKAIQAGRVRTRAGKEVSEPIEGGLIRADRLFLYPIRHNIPIMLVDESIPFDGRVNNS